MPRLANPAGVLAWNTDKRYLRQLAAQGLPVVSTTWLPPGQDWTPPEHGDWVIKPVVSLASLDTGRYRASRPGECRLAAEHVHRLHLAGRTAMIQPYLQDVDVAGETSLTFIDGVFSHAVRRCAALNGPDIGIDLRFAPGGGLKPRRVEPDAYQMTLATRVLESVTPHNPLLYARVDLISGVNRRPVLIEVELTEPQLFLALCHEAIDRMADAVEARVRQAAPISTVAP